PFAKGGVVSGSASSTFDPDGNRCPTATCITPVTFDSRTLKTNYNVLDNSTWAYDTWLRTGFECALANNVTLKNQSYYYQAKRSWLDSETYGFNNDTNKIDRDRFFVGHKQNLIGNNTDLTWDSYLYGMENRLAAQLQVSRNKLTFTQHAGNFPDDA